MDLKDFRISGQAAGEPMKPGSHPPLNRPEDLAYSGGESALGSLKGEISCCIHSCSWRLCALLRHLASETLHLGNAVECRVQPSVWDMR